MTPTTSPGIQLQLGIELQPEEDSEFMRLSKEYLLHTAVQRKEDDGQKRAGNETDIRPTSRSETR